MPALALSLLGAFQLMRDGRPIVGLASNKVRALLAYLAVEANRSHTRVALAGLLWPERPDRVALANLRSALANLRRVLGDSPADSRLLLTTHTTIRLDLSRGGLWLDTADFCRTLDDPAADRDGLALERATALYRGDFLEGLATGSAPFEEWVLICREQYGRRMLTGLERSALLYETAGDQAHALACARRQLDLAPWHEGAHQHVIRLLALSGQRSAALAQYETCRRVLAAELDAEPAAETSLLAERIRRGTWPDRAAAASTPGVAAASISGQARMAIIDRLGAEQRPAAEPGASTTVAVSLSGRDAGLPDDVPLFAGRAAQLRWLGRFLAATLDGRSQVVFVTGEAGSGKTALVAELGRQAVAAHPDLLVVWGRCNVHTGAGDSYLPFAEILRALTGHMEARRAGGPCLAELDRRLQAAVPDAIQTLLDVGPDLVGSLLSADALARHIQTLFPGSEYWARRLEALASRPAGLLPADLCAQYAAVLRALARRRPLLVVVDDLHWADDGSISLLFHLGRHLAGSPILLAGIYRPAGLDSAHAGGRHLLAQVTNELQSALGDIRLDLGQADGREFVNDVLDAEPNQLRAGFREMLYHHTGGHALFTVELLRALRERGELRRDDDGQWIEGPALEWDRLPVRVEAVIVESIGRLPASLQSLLEAASVEGEEFHVETLAHVLRADQGRLIRALSGRLSREHRVVEASGIVRVDPGGRQLARYRFRHYSYRSYLYQRLDNVERARLHELTGQALAALYGEQQEEIAATLAWHFEQAGNADRATDYCLQAGTRAVRLGAYAEALSHLSRGLSLLATLPDSCERARREIRLHLALGVPLEIQGWRVPERERAVPRAYEPEMQGEDE